MNKPDLEPYRALAEAGPLAVAEEAARQGLENIEIIWVLRQVCRVDVGTAKALMDRVRPERMQRLLELIGPEPSEENEGS
ncbi:hypothetical protein [Deinococcus aluminii]|uniref:hypothetical protein n=1 Tax=Deinococcus aluminii TaxID=1656885 RepID=UPI0031F09013